MRDGSVNVPFGLLRTGQPAHVWLVQLARNHRLLEDDICRQPGTITLLFLRVLGRPHPFRVVADEMLECSYHRNCKLWPVASHIPLNVMKDQRQCAQDLHTKLHTIAAPRLVALKCVSCSEDK